ncbi:MAG: c-type cytochrome [Qipengyuania pacifica]
MTGDAGPTRTRIPSAEGDDLSGYLVSPGARLRLAARCEHRQHSGAHEYRGGFVHPFGNLRRGGLVPVLTRGSILRACLFFNLLVLLCAGLAACKQPPGPRYVPDAETTQRGREAIERVGCAACHEIPGIDWPRGRTGPSLLGFDDIGPIAGALPNTPENLAAFVRNAPAAKPGSAMPAMPLSEEEARDVAAYLYGLDDE